jgi:DNA-binding response OmpR family regulator
MKNILLVEDDPFIRDLTSVKLNEKGFAVEVAHDGESALALLKREHSDLVILDLNLPGINGLDVLSAMKSDPLTKSIPVIIFTNEDDPETKVSADKIGVQGFYIKASTSFDDLCAHVRTIIGE